MIERKRLSPQTSLTEVFAGTKLRLDTLLLSLLVTFASMALSDVAFPALDLTIATLVAAAFLTGSAIAAERAGQLSALRGDLDSAASARLFSLVLLAWSVFLLLAFVNWQAAAIAALSLPALVTINRGGSRQAWLILDSCLMALPAIIGGAAATSKIEPPALILFIIIFFWRGIDSRLTLLRERFDAHEGDLLLGTAEYDTTRGMLFQALQLVIVSMLPVLLLPLIHVDGRVGVAYPIAAMAMGMMITLFASRVARDLDDANLRRLGDILTLYPFLLVLALVIDRILQQGS